MKTKIQYTHLQPKFQFQIYWPNSATLLFKLSALTPTSQGRYQHPPLTYSDAEYPHYACISALR